MGVSSSNVSSYLELIQTRRTNTQNWCDQYSPRPVRPGPNWYYREILY